jgi:nitrogen fixation protein NifQ
VHRLHRLLEDLPEEVLHPRGGGVKGLGLVVHAAPAKPASHPALAPAGPALNLAIPPAVLAERAASRADEVADLRALLLDHVAVGTPECQANALAQAVALATLGDRHLWEDLGLPSRGALGLLMERHFPDLVARNSAGMRWKKFLHRELCQREGVLVCRSPSCSTCDEQVLCFAPE